ncbi:MAG: glycosyltransferase [Cyanobacteria bacterium J06598_3]
MAPENIRLLIVVENADYREHLSDIFLPEMLSERLSNRISPADLHILEAAAHWGDRLQEVAIFSCHSSETYSEVSYLGIRLMGSGIQALTSEYVGERDRVKLVADFCPTHIVLCSPNYPVLHWATRNSIASVVLLSDWQGPLGWRQQRRHNRLIKQLNHQSVEWVGNHGVFACTILEASGINNKKIIPWEWPQPQKLSQYVIPKQIRYEQSEISLVYAGPISPRAGINDLLMAVSNIHKKGNSKIQLKVISNQLNVDIAPTKVPEQPLQTQPLGEVPHTLELLQVQTQQLGIADSVSFSSALSNEQIIEEMRDADLVVIPGCAHDFPVEPPASLYMAMAARTPIIATDQPHFDEHLSHGVNAMIYPTGNDKSMAHRIERVMNQPQLYAQLSEASEVALTTLKVPARWSELIDRWINAGVENDQWLCNYAFSSGRYQALSATERQLAFLSQAKQ